MFHTDITGAMFPMQAYLYAKVISAFQLKGESLVHAGNFWALMFFVLAIVVGLAYYGVAAIGAGLGGVSLVEVHETIISY